VDVLQVIDKVFRRWVFVGTLFDSYFGRGAGVIVTEGLSVNLSACHGTAAWSGLVMTYVAN
jgi:hypothetical protein